MKILQTKHRRSAFTFTEVALVLIVVVLLAAFFLSARTGSRKATGLICLSNVKQIGLAFRIWANDHEEKFPWQVPIANGGSMEFLEATQAFRHFLVASNEMNTSRILTCRQDAKRSATTNWSRVSNRNLSYFVGLDAKTGNSQSILLGDRSLSTNQSLGQGVLTISTNQQMSWAPGLHPNFGNIGFSDGSAEMFHQPQLNAGLQTNACLPARVLIP